MERGGSSYGYYDNWASHDPYGFSRTQPSADSRASTRRGDYPMNDYHQHNHSGMAATAHNTGGPGFALEPSKIHSTNFEPSVVAGSSGKLWDHQDTSNSRTSSQQQQQQQQQQKQRSSPVQRIFRRFAERCSMQGPPYIYASTWWFPRLAWTLFLLAAMGVMSYHLLYLCKTYFAWPTKNKLNLGFSSLQFPAVTVCNVNPVRASKLNLMSQDLQQFVKDINPATIGGIIDNVPKGQSSGRRRRDTSEEEPAGDNDAQLDDWALVQFNRTGSNIREDYDRDETLKNLKGYTTSWEKESKQSTFSRLESFFFELYAAEKRTKRVKAGHQLKDMLQSCSFAGRSCYPNNFTLITNTKFGNCYTLQYDKFISRDSGPTGGLELLFFLDTEEYVRAITPDDGLQVSVHSQTTVPFPVDDGVAVAAGSHTKLSLRLVHIERKSQPYGECTSPNMYNAQYNVSYSKQLCLRFCLQTNVIRDCGCRDETADDINVLMNTTSSKPCRNKQEVQCLEQTIWKYQSGDISCQCFNPCSESKYEKSLSSRPWPNKEYALNLLVKTACRRLTDSRCQKLRSKDAQELSREFVKLNIFYEDLNYENITEEPDYETVQFVSDIGGTLGLWIGLSVLSVLEVLQLVVDLVSHLCCCCLNTRKIK